MLRSYSRAGQGAKRLTHLTSEAKAPHPAESPQGEGLDFQRFRQGVAHVGNESTTGPVPVWVCAHNRSMCSHAGRPG